MVLFLFCSCSTTFKVNGVDIKQRTKPIDKSHEPPQKEALEKDIESIIKEIQTAEELLEGYKTRKSLAFKELRAIEKKLAKL